MTIAAQPLLLADTGPFCRFAETGDEQVGEVATILVANQLDCPVLIDERWGKETFAPRKGVATYSTEDLAVEMAAVGVLTAEQAFAVFERVYHRDRAAFDARLAAWPDR